MLRRVAETPRSAAGRRGDLAAVIEMLRRPPRRRGLVAVISDFLGEPAARGGDRYDWERPLRALRVRHEVLAVEVLDPRELALPAVGLLTVVDPETGQQLEVQSSDADLRERYAAAAAAQRSAIASALRGAGAAHLRLRTDSDWLLDIVRFVAAQRHARTRGTTR